MSTTMAQTTRYACRGYYEVCEFATEYGYCRLTTCAKHPQTIATNFTTSTIDTNNDVVEVVRCKDCDFWNKDENILGGICDEWSDFEDGLTRYTKGDDYCSLGERKEK